MSYSKGILVTFVSEIHDDKAKKLLLAIEHLNGVLKAELVESNFDDVIIQNQVHHELGQKLIAIIYPKLAS